MSQQHLVREIQQLKHEVALLKEGGLGPGEQEFNIPFLIEWIKGLDKRMGKLEASLKHTTERPDIEPHEDPDDPWGDTPDRFADQPDSAGARHRMSRRTKPY